MSNDPLVGISVAAVVMSESDLLRAAYKPAWEETFRRSTLAYMRETGKLVPDLPDDETMMEQADEARMAAYFAAAREAQPFIAVALRSAASAIPSGGGGVTNDAAKEIGEALAECTACTTAAVRAAIEREALWPRGLRRVLGLSSRVRAAAALAQEAQARSAAAVQRLGEVANECANSGVALDALGVLASALEDESGRWRDQSEAVRITAMAQALADQRSRALDGVQMISRLSARASRARTGPTSRSRRAARRRRRP